LPAFNGPKIRTREHSPLAGSFEDLPTQQTSCGQNERVEGPARRLKAGIGKKTAYQLAGGVSRAFQFTQIAGCLPNRIRNMALSWG